MLFSLSGPIAYYGEPFKIPPGVGEPTLARFFLYVAIPIGSWIGSAVD
jgi:hypothetical protein